MKIKSEKAKQSPSLIFSNMKKLSAKLESNQSISTVSTSGTSIDYLFVTDKKLRWNKEWRVKNFLNSEGIFQIHISVALNEFKKSIFSNFNERFWKGASGSC